MLILTHGREERFLFCFGSFLNMADPITVER